MSKSCSSAWLVTPNQQYCEVSWLPTFGMSPHMLSVTEDEAAAVLCAAYHPPMESSVSCAESGVRCDLGHAFLAAGQRTQPSHTFTGRSSSPT